MSNEWQDKFARFAHFKTGEKDKGQYLESIRPLGNFRAISINLVIDTLRSESKDWIALLTQEEKRLITKYTYNSGDKQPVRFYERLNAMLRGEIEKELKMMRFLETKYNSNKSRSRIQNMHPIFF